MAIDFRCKSCGARYQHGDAMAGESFKCEACGVHMQIPHKTALDTDTVADTAPASLDKTHAEAPGDKTDTIKVPSVTWAKHRIDDIKFACKICGHKYRLSKEFAGCCAECSKCRRILIIPKHSDDAPAVSQSGEITFWCKKCGQKYRLPQQYAGNSANCSKCAEVFVVPDVSGTAPGRLPASTPEPRDASVQETKHDSHKKRARGIKESLASKSLQTQTSVEITGNPVSMVRYVLSSPDSNIAASAFSALIDWIRQFRIFKPLPRAFIGTCIILCIAAVIAVVIKFLFN